MSQNKKMTLGSSFKNMFKRMFGGDKAQMSVLEEEAIQTPLQTIIKNFMRNRLGMIGLVMFIGFLLFSFLGSYLYPIELTYTELPNANLAPGTNYLSVPANVNAKNVKQIVSGISFSVALLDDGTVHVWGTEPNQKLPGVSDYVLEVPEAVKNANITQIATGGKHVLGVTDADEGAEVARDDHVEGGPERRAGSRLPDGVCQSLRQLGFADGRVHRLLLMRDGRSAGAGRPSCSRFSIRIGTRTFYLT